MNSPSYLTYRLAAFALMLGGVLALFAGTVITDNLPPDTAIINIDARVDGAAGSANNYALWYRPFNASGGGLLQYTVQPGVYSFRVINHADVAQKFPALTAAQTNQMYSGWTYNSPWITDYLVFPGAAATDGSVAQLFDGSPDPGNYSNDAAAYAGAVSSGFYNQIRADPAGRAGTNFTDRYTFASPTTLIFSIADYGLGDNGGGVSVLVSPAGSMYNVDWSTIDSGGGVSSDGTLTIAGTAGQPDAGVSSDGTLTLQGGFWPALLPPSPPAFNPNFKVYYSTFNYPNDVVGVVNGDGSGNMQIVPGQWPRLSPDGKWLAYHPRDSSTASRGNLGVLNLASNTSATIVYNGDYLVSYDWAADSTRLIYDMGCQIYRVNRDGAANASLFGLSCYDDAPVINPVDGSLAYHSYDGLYRSQTSGSGRHRISNTAAGDYWPTWSPDAQWLVAINTGGYYFKIHPDGTGRTNLFALLPGTSIITDQSAAAAFSPDGQWVIAAFNLGGTNGIYAVASDGSGFCLPILTAPAPTQIYSFIGSVVATGVTRPQLILIRAGAGQAMLSWSPNTSGFKLQENTGLSSASWTDALTGNTNPVILSLTNAVKVYRLYRP